MSDKEKDELGIPLALKRAAEDEMRRILPGSEATRDSKKPKLGTDDTGPADKPAAPTSLVARFDYSGAHELANGIQGFMLTCDFRREQSATKEVARVLVDKMDPDTDDEALKKKLSILKLGSRGVVALKCTHPASSPLATDPVAAAQYVTSIVESILADCDTKSIAPFQFGQRLIPIQTTSSFTIEALTEAGARLAPLAPAYLVDTATTISFAVAYKSRKAGDKSDNQTETIDRIQVIKAVAGGFEAALKGQHTVTVDLKNPSLVILIEMLPIVNDSTLYVGMCVLPSSMCHIKAKCSIKPLLVKEKQAKQGGAGKK